MNCHQIHVSKLPNIQVFEHMDDEQITGSVYCQIVCDFSALLLNAVQKH